MKIPFEIQSIELSTDEEGVPVLSYSTIDLSLVSVYSQVFIENLGEATEIVVDGLVVIAYIPYKEFRSILRFHFRPCSIINFN
jgi:hypothetical protein